MTPETLRRIRRDERRAYRSAGYRPGERTADPGQNYTEIPSREEAPGLYEDLDSMLERRVYPSEVQDYFAFADGDEGNIKSLYDYEYSDGREQQAILDPIAEWIEDNIGHGRFY